MGQSITCRVDEVKGSGRVVRLSVNPVTLARTFADASHDWNLTSLQPGLLVKAKIKTVTMGMGTFCVFFFLTLTRSLCKQNIEINIYNRIIFRFRFRFRILY